MKNNVGQKLITDRSEKSIGKYLDEIRNNESLSREEEYRLSILIKKGDNRALNKLIEANLKYVITEAKKYQTGVIPLSELIAQGNEGAIEAAKRFDGEKGFKFITYMKPWIKQSILAYISKYGRKITIPQNQVTLYNKIRKYRENYQQSNGFYPPTQEVAEYLDESYKNVDFLINKLRSVISIDNTYANDSNSTVGDYIEDSSLGKPTDKLMSESTRIDICRILGKLPQREREIIKMIFGIDYTREYYMDEVANKFNITTERIRQIKRESIGKLKSLMIENNII